jgi:hypothetical protein
VKLFPSAAVRIAGSSDIVAWGFLGPDGSLTSLHCEVISLKRGEKREANSINQRIERISW